jgi:hypothetical protein
MGCRTLHRLRHDDPRAMFSRADLERTPQQRFAIAEELIALSFRMRGCDGRVRKDIARVFRRRR